VHHRRNRRVLLPAAHLLPLLRPPAAEERTVLDDWSIDTRGCDLLLCGAEAVEDLLDGGAAALGVVVGVVGGRGGFARCLSGLVGLDDVVVSGVGGRHGC
jgi:hypothetical protein